MRSVAIPVSLIPFLALNACVRDASDPSSPAADPVPVILVSLDTCRADALTPFGGEARNSPHLERLARESVVFRDCLSQSSNTAPSHRSLFSGQFVHRHGHDVDSFRESPAGLARMLRDAGWSTAAFTGGGFLARGYGFEDGFDTYVDRDDEARGAVNRGLATILPQAQRWLDARRPDEPFFLFLHTFDIHCPYEPAEPWRSEFTAGYEGDLELEGLCGQEDYQRVLARAGVLGPEAWAADVELLHGTYDAGVAEADDQLGRFLDGLRDDGTLDRSLLIVLSDHGESLAERRPFIGHNRMWEEQLEVPLLVRFPGGRFGGTVCDEPTMLVDVLPTVAELLGLTAPAGVQGESLLPLLDGRRSYDGERLRVSQFLSLFSFRYDDRWKVHGQLGAEGRGTFLLFDLDEDPHEQVERPVDPATRSEHDTRMRELVSRFAAWRRSTAAEDAGHQQPLLEERDDPEQRRDLEELGYTSR
jgi:arylsulfatase A-like enzyme